MNLKNIIYITYQTFPANTANSLQTILNIKYFIKKGINVKLIFPLRDTESNAQIEKINKHYGENIQFESIGTKHNYPFGKFEVQNRILFIVSHFLWSKNISTKIAKNYIPGDYFFTRSDWVFYFLSKRKVPVIFECHQYTKFRKYIISLSLKNNNSKIIFLNENLKIDYEKNFPLDGNYSVLHNGVDEEFFQKTQKNKNQIIFVGKLTRFGKTRNIDFLISAFSKLDDSYSFKIIGATKEEVQIYNDILDRLNLSHRVEILEYMNHKKVIRYICESEIGILINSHENQHSTKYTSPLKYFEYLYGDVKVVAANFTSHKYLPFSQNISFFSIGDENSFINSIYNTKSISNLNPKDKKLLSLDKRSEKIISLFIN